MIKLTGKVSKNNILKLIKTEQDATNNYLAIQQGLHKQILFFLKNFIGNLEIENISTTGYDVKIVEYITTSNLNLQKIQFNIDSINEVIKKIENLINSFDSSTTKELKDKISEYNNYYKKNMNKIFSNTTSIENFIHQVSLLDLNVSNTEETEVSQADNIEMENQIKNSDLLENTLLISEKSQKVIFPYTIPELQTKLEESQSENNDTKYQSLEDVVERAYTYPISNYRFSALSRFKEAYKLILNKESGSKKQAISLALELFGNYNLHPAIISACKNLNELDVYLSCLEYDELDDFHFFKVKYEVDPVPIAKFEKFRNIFTLNTQKDTIEE